MKKIITTIIGTVIAASCFGQNFSSVMSDTNGVVQRPTNFLSANKIFQTNDLTNTQFVTENNKQFALRYGAGVWNAFVQYGVATQNGTNGQTTAASYQRRIETTGTNTSIFFQINPRQTLFSKVPSPNGIQWSRPVWMIFAAYVKAVDDTLIRMQLGGQAVGGTNIGPLTITNASFQGMGLVFSNGSVFVEANHGTTNRSISSSVASYGTAFGDRVDVKLRSSGTNTIAVYVNNVLSTNLPFGPTVDASNTSPTWNVSINTTTSTNYNFIDIHNSQLMVIVE